MTYEIFYLFILGFIISCKNQSPNYFIGKWKLDSSSGPSGKLFAAYQSKDIELKKDGSFFYEWWQGDVGNKYKGRLSIKNTTNGIRIIEFISDKSNNIIRQYKILESSKNRLKMSREESYEVKDSTLTFTRIDIFKRNNRK